MKKIFQETKIPLFFLTLFFMASVFGGYNAGVNHPVEARGLFDSLNQNFSYLKNVNIIAMFFFIFVNNAVKTAFMMMLGTFFGIVPVIVVAVNGVLIGLISSLIITDHGVSYLFMGIIPHGILEIPAFLVAGAYGLQLGRKYYRKIKYGEIFKPHFMRAISRLLRYLLPILALASFIETFITMTLLRSL